MSNLSAPGLEKLDHHEPIESKHYFFGEDFYDAYDDAMASPVPENWLQQLMVQLMQDAQKDAAKKQAAQSAHDSEPEADQTGIVEL